MDTNRNLTMSGTLIGTKEAAEILAERFGAYSHATVQKLARRGKIPGAKKIGNTWLIPLKWAETHEKTRV